MDATDISWGNVLELGDQRLHYRLHLLHWSGSSGE